MRSGGYGLGFIDSRKLYESVSSFVERVEHAKSNVNLHKNVIDPFSALFEAGLVVGLNSRDWLEVERGRQIGKSLANAVGDLHQELIGQLPGWYSTGKSGGVVDLFHENPFGVNQTPVLAELKNKHNTMNSSSQNALHSRFQDTLKWPQYKGYSAYLIEVIPKKRGFNDEPWAPPGRGQVPQIRKIDAASVYRESSGGNPLALRQLFDVLPLVLIDIVGETNEMLVLQQDDGFSKLFSGAFAE